MFRFIPVTFVALGLTLPTFAGDKPSVRRDTEFPVEVHTGLKSGSVRVGDTIEFRTAEAVLIGNGVVVPRNATILGTVTEVRSRNADGPRALIRIRIHTLRWKSGEASLNAMVSAVRHVRFSDPNISFPQLPTFMEGIRIVSHLRHEAVTDFFSDQRNFTIRSGVGLMLRQIDPEAFPDRDFNVLSANDSNKRESLVQ